MPASHNRFYSAPGARSFIVATGYTLFTILATFGLLPITQSTIAGNAFFILNYPGVQLLRAFPTYFDFEYMSEGHFLSLMITALLVTWVCVYSCAWIAMRMWKAQKT